MAIAMAKTLVHLVLLTLANCDKFYRIDFFSSDACEDDVVHTSFKRMDACEAIHYDSGVHYYYFKWTCSGNLLEKTTYTDEDCQDPLNEPDASFEEYFRQSASMSQPLGCAELLHGNAVPDDGSVNASCNWEFPETYAQETWDNPDYCNAAPEETEGWTGPDLFTFPLGVCHARRDESGTNYWQMSCAAGTWKEEAYSDKDRTSALPGESNSWKVGACRGASKMLSCNAAQKATLHLFQVLLLLLPC